MSAGVSDVEQATIILFDGACNLCSGVVKFLVARNRYRWFGRAEACMVPTPELRSRFLG